MSLAYYLPCMSNDAVLTTLYMPPMLDDSYSCPTSILLVAYPLSQCVVL